MTPDQALKIFNNGLALRDGNSPIDTTRAAYHLDEIPRGAVQQWITDPPEMWDHHIHNTLATIVKLAGSGESHHLILLKDLGGSTEGQRYPCPDAHRRGDGQTLPKLNRVGQNGTRVASTPLSFTTVTTVWKWLWVQIDKL